MGEEQAIGGSRIHLIESDDEQPYVRLEVGKRYEVVATAVVDADLKTIADEEARKSAPPRLCGSRSTCVAIVEIDPERF
jgi:hypothetical protein